MAYRALVSLVAALLLVVAGCSGETDDGVAFDPERAESCQELVDMFIGSHLRLLDALGTMTEEDLAGDVPSGVEAAGQEIDEWLYGAAGERVADLCPGGLDEFETLACEQASQLVAAGPAAERHLRDNFPRCGQP